MCLHQFGYGASWAGLDRATSWRFIGPPTSSGAGANCAPADANQWQLSDLVGSWQAIFGQASF